AGPRALPAVERQRPAGPQAVDVVALAEEGPLVAVVRDRHPLAGDVESLAAVIEAVVVADDDALLEAAGAPAAVAGGAQRPLVDVDAAGLAIVEEDDVAALVGPVRVRPLAVLEVLAAPGQQVVGHQDARAVDGDAGGEALRVEAVGPVAGV